MGLSVPPFFRQVCPICLIEVQQKPLDAANLCLIILAILPVNALSFLAKQMIGCEKVGSND
jgi:hypothetical protein